jgi:hypothetical protein
MRRWSWWRSAGSAGVGLLLTLATGSPAGAFVGPNRLAAQEPAELVASLADAATRDEARGLLRAHARELPPERRGPWLHLVTTLETPGMGPVAGYVAGQAVLLSEADPLPRQQTREAARLEAAGILEGFALAPDRPEEEALPLLALASHLAGPADPREAYRLRELYGARRGWPGPSADGSGVAPEEDAHHPSGALRVEEAALLLAHARAGLAGVEGGRDGGESDPRELLTHLLMNAPDHPLAPEARRLLQGAPGVPGAPGRP